MKTNEKTQAHQRYRLRPTSDWPKGEIVPGVTTILDGQLGWNKRVLMAWSRREALKGNDPDAMAQEAADSGTVSHKLVEAHIKGVEADLKDFTQNQIDAGKTGFSAFLDWEKDNQLEYDHIEYPVVSEKHRYGGTIDMIAHKDGSLWLIDLKTSSGIWPEMKCQVAAYWMAFEEQEQRQVQEWHILKLDKKDGSFQHHKLAGREVCAAWKVFLHCRALYDLQKDLK